jgi:hypothetical protein
MINCPKCVHLLQQIDELNKLIQQIMSRDPTLIKTPVIQLTSDESAEAAKLFIAERDRYRKALEEIKRDIGLAMTGDPNWDFGERLYDIADRALRGDAGEVTTT